VAPPAGDESLTVAVDGPINVDDVEVAVRAAMEGVGLAVSLEERRAAPREWSTRPRA
jgi:hypothetical protein